MTTFLPRTACRLLSMEIYVVCSISNFQSFLIASSISSKMENHWSTYYIITNTTWETSAQYSSISVRITECTLHSLVYSTLYRCKFLFAISRLFWTYTVVRFLDLASKKTTSKHTNALPQFPLNECTSQARREACLPFTCADDDGVNTPWARRPQSKCLVKIPSDEQRPNNASCFISSSSVSVVAAWEQLCVLRCRRLQILLYVVVSFVQIAIELICIVCLHLTHIWCSNGETTIGGLSIAREALVA